MNARQRDVPLACSRDTFVVEAQPLGLFPTLAHPRVVPLLITCNSCNCPMTDLRVDVALVCPFCDKRDIVIGPST